MRAASRQSAMSDRSPWAIFLVFLRLGLTSFGGPVAHIGYLRDELVGRRRWLDEAAYAELVALCQFLPGPASSQVGFALGVLRSGGLGGGVAAWLGFTLPSALLLLAFALGANSVSGPLADGVVQGLKLVAVAMVAQAIWAMAGSLTADARRIALALLAALLVTLFGGALMQLLVIGMGALAGLLICSGRGQPLQALVMPVSRGGAISALLLFVAGFVGLPLLMNVWPGSWLALFDAFFRAGALVFGGGHVVLPLLQGEVVATGWVSGSAFLAGYGLAQAVPGPLFTVAAYLGAAAQPSAGVAGAAIALFGIFLPGLLLVYGALPFWARLRTSERAQAAIAGANAAVVGILLAAFCGPVWVGAITGWLDVLLAVSGFVALLYFRVAPWQLVLAMAVIGALRSTL